MMQEITIWLVMALITEFLVVESIYSMAPIMDRWQERLIPYINLKLMISFLVGGLLAYGALLDIFRMFDIPFILPYVGVVVSAFGIMKGHEGINTFMELYRNKLKIEAVREMFEDE